MRTVTVTSTQATPSRISFDSNASTWGALKSEISAQGMSPEGMKAVLRTTKATLEMDDAVLPEGDVTIFLTPGKVKSGDK